MIDCAKFFIFFLACVTLGAAFSLYLSSNLSKGILEARNDDGLSFWGISRAPRLKLLLALIALAFCILGIFWAMANDVFSPKYRQHRKSLDPRVEQSYQAPRPEKELRAQKSSRVHTYEVG